MQWAIEFDDDFAFEANEICDVRPNQGLALKLETAKLSISDMLPEFVLDGGWFVAHLARS